MASINLLQKNEHSIQISAPSGLLDLTSHGKEKIIISNVALFLIDPKSQLSKCFESAKCSFRCVGGHLRTYMFLTKKISPLENE